MSKSTRSFVLYTVERKNFPTTLLSGHHADPDPCSLLDSADTGRGLLVLAGVISPCLSAEFAAVCDSVRNSELDCPEFRLGFGWKLSAGTVALNAEE